MADENTADETEETDFKPVEDEEEKDDESEEEATDFKPVEDEERDDEDEAD